jgi:RHS repeat-associated protein
MNHNPILKMSRCARVVFAALLTCVVGNVAFAAAEGTRYYVNDHLATTVGIADAAGEIAALEADAFGSPLAGGANAGRFTGKPYDEDLGAYVFPFRNYRADEARWMSADPSGFPDGVNGRHYAPNVFLGLDAYGLSKSLLWLFLEDSSQPNDPAIGEIQAGFNNLYQNLTDADALPTNPQYLSDGDSFSFMSTSNFDFLSGSAINGFTKVFVVGHGYGSGSSVSFAVGGQFYTESEIKGANSKIAMFNGCFSTAANGQIITTGAVVSAWSMPTRNYLYE